MRKTILKLLFIATLITLLFTMLVPAASAAGGSCGTSATWDYNSSTRTLTISGTGAISFTGTTAPWYSNRGTMSKVIIGEGITSIPSKSFQSCPLLKELSLPSTLKTIESGAFYSCTGLTSVVIPEGVTSFANGFYSCTKLATVTLPKEFTTVNLNTFSGCTALKNIIVPSGCTQHCTVDGILYSKNMAVLEFAPPAYATDIVVPEGVTTIGNNAMTSLKNVTRITLPSTLTHVNTAAFQKCTKLTSMVFPEGMVSLESTAFLGCTALTEVVLPSTLEVFGTQVFDSCTAMQSVTMTPDTNENFIVRDNTIITKNKLVYCVPAKEGTYIVPEGVTTLTGNAFSGCSKLTDVLLPESLDSIAAYAFKGCSSLSSLHFLGKAPTTIVANGVTGLTLCYLAQSGGWASLSGYTKAEWTYTSTSTASCDRDGYDTISCKHCSAEFRRFRSSNGAHTLGDRVLAQVPTTTAAGRWEQTCTQCGTVISTPIDPIIPTQQGTKVSTNMDRNDYKFDRWTQPMTSFLFKEEDGYVRAEYNDLIDIEFFDENLNFLSRRSLPMELPVFGGIFSGEKYNFVVYGQENLTDSDRVETIRIVRYAKNWYRIDALNLYGLNTFKPFESGRVIMAESNGVLYITTVHEQYANLYNIHAQSNMRLLVDQEDMILKDSQYKTDSFTGFVSHSFNQSILVDGSDVVTIDQGDSTPRALVLTRFSGSAGSVSFGTGTATEILPIRGTPGDNVTGLTLGGFAASGSNYLTVGTSIDQTSNAAVNSQKNLYVAVTNKSTLSTNIVWLTTYATNGGVTMGVPKLAKISNNSFVVLWTERSALRYCFIDGNGKRTSTTYSDPVARISDCEPVVEDGRILWYYTNNSGPIFCTIDLSFPSYVQMSHIHSYFATVRKMPTATMTGQATITCGYCHTETNITLPVLNETNYTFTSDTPHCADDTYDIYTMNDYSYGVIQIRILQEKIPHMFEDMEYVEPSTYSKGYYHFNCSNCRYTYDGVFAPLSEADYVVEVTREATCTEEGIVSYTTDEHTAFGTLTFTEEIPALGHIDSETNTPATCTEAGSRKIVCSRCGDIVSQSSIPATGHTLVTDAAVEATCTTAGLTKGYHCSVCNTVVTPQTVIPALGHDMVVVESRPGSCTEGSYTLSRCTRCNVKVEDVTPAGSHTVVTDEAVAATCTESGLTIGSHCSVCGTVIEKQTVIPATGHNNSVIRRAAPTCLINGSITYRCKNCDLVSEVIIYAPGHNYVTVYGKAPTCTTPGKTDFTYCTNCYMDYGPAQEIPATGHSWDAGVISGSQKIFTCKVCGETKTEAYTAPAKLSIKQASLALQNDISVNFYVLDSSLVGYTDPYVVFTKDIYDTDGNVVDTVSITVREFEEGTYAGVSPAHVYSFAGISANEMTSNISATLYATFDGTLMNSKTINYSVETYIAAMLGNTIPDAFRDCLVDMVRYGTAAQHYWNYNTANLISDILKESDLQFGHTEAPALSSVLTVVPQTGSTISFRTVSLALQQRVEVNYYLNLKNYTGSLQDLKLVATYDDTTVEIDSSEFIYQDYNNTYLVVLRDLTSTQMRSVIEAKVVSKTTGKQVSTGLIYSVESFAYSKINDPAMSPVTNALINFSDSAKAFFG